MTVFTFCKLRFVQFFSLNKNETPGRVIDGFNIHRIR